MGKDEKPYRKAGDSGQAGMKKREKKVSFRQKYSIIYVKYVTPSVTRTVTTYHTALQTIVRKGDGLTVY